MKTRLKRVFLFMLSALMLFTSLPLSVFAEVNYKYDDLTDNKSEIVNKLTPVKPAKPEAGKTAEDLIKNPDQPAIYTLRTDYKVQRGEKYQVDYQPYIASVGEGASDAEKAKVNKTMPMPAIAGYEKPQENLTIDYKTVKAADGKNKKGDATNGLRYSANEVFNYDALSNKIQIKHVFQKLDDFTKYTNPDGSVGEEGALITTQNGNTGSTVQASPLSETDPRRKGFVPEADYINMQVPENAKDFILEYRYNRAHYDVVYDTQGGSPLPTRTLYYEQVIPKIADESIPTKVGGVFQGWKPSVELTTKNGKTYKANEIIKDGNGKAIEKLDNNLIMPASKVTFTAVWTDKEKADYAVQFWAERADHADNASLSDKYDYIGTRVYKDQATGSRPDLDTVPVDKIVFPDLDQARLQKIWNGTKFNQDKYLYLNKFYVYNQDLTHDQNKDPKKVNRVKKVEATGETVYNIYYDRQVYDLYFTKSNVSGSAFYPEITKDGKEVGKAGNPYHFKARFNQNLVGLWPDDVKEVKGFTEGKYSLGWLPNLKTPKHYYRDTPPYRLSANLFIDCPDLEKQGGYVSEIDLGNGQTKPASITDLSFGIDQGPGTIPHHIDFWLDDFDDNQVIDYDLYTIKSDTDNSEYKDFLPPDLQGFTPKTTGGRGSEFKDKYDLEDFNDDREEITPFPKVYSKELDEDGEPKQKGKLYFMKNFPGDEDREFDQNGYLKFEYSRNKYPLRFNYDPSIIRDDSYFNDKNQLDTFYEFPLKALSPEADTEKSYKTGNPKNILDDPEKLQALGLTDLVFTDTDGKLKVKRPDNLSNQMVFKGWALDPAGTTLVSDKKSEKMPSHAVNLYAKWGEPDYQWKVTFDPNGGSLRNIKEEDLTKERKTVQVGDIGQEEIKTFAKKEANDGDKQVFTVIQRQKLVAPKFIPKRKGYDFMGWEVIRYKKDPTTGDYTTEQDTSYRETYKVPELYSFGNDVVSPIYLKAIWVPNDRVDVDVIHHFLSLDLSKETKTIPETLHNKRTGYLVATSADKQNEEYILATNDELNEKLPDELKTLYKEYNDRVKANNTFFQTFKVEPEKIDDGNGKLIPNPKFKDNVFHFFYRPFRTRDYKVNYIDERGKGEVEKFFKGLNLTDTSSLKDDALLKANESNKKKFEDNREAFEKLIKEYQIVDPEAVSNGNRHYDARNYRQIPGWVIAKNEKPQQQLFFDVNEETNEFLGINGTGADQVFFYYKDVRVIEVPNKDDPVPDGYVRVTFKADKGGAFTDKDGNSKTELYYDVIKGLKSDLLPEPKELEEGKTKEEGKYYITPETGKKFIKWDEKPLLNKNTIVDNDTKDFYVFTAKFEWSGLSASGLVRTEAFKDPNGKWTNDFAPTIEDLKKQLVWMEKGKVEKLPAGAVIKLYDEAGTELTKDEQVYNLVNEKGKADKDELVRTVNVKAKVTFKDGKEPQELTIPITVYKNVYEALNKAGDKPLFLKEAEAKEAKDGGLKDILKDNDGNRYIKVTIKPNKDFTNKDDKVYYVNPNAWVEIPNDSNGTTSLINWTADKVGQNDNGEANGKFDFGKRHKFTEDTVISPRLSQTSELVAHESYKDSKNKWVNDFIDSELTDDKLKAAIQVKNGSATALGAGDTVTIVDDAGEKYANADALKAVLYEKLKEKDDDGKASRIENIKVKVTFANGEVQTLTVPVKVIKNIYQAKTKTGKPDYVPANYVKVTLDPTTKAKDPQKYFYYVNPDAKVLIPGNDPEGVKEDFTGWTMKADGATGAGTSYKLNDRHQFAKDSTIIAQYGQGKVRIKYVDENKKEIDPKYQIVGVDYPTEKIGKIGDNIPDPVDSQNAEKAAAPKFKGYIISSVSLDNKSATYTDPATATITYKYSKKVTTEDKSQNDTQYFPVIFDANSGEFGTDPKNQKIVYVAFDGNSSTLEKVTFEEVRQAIEEKYGKPSKADETFVEWQDKATDGNKVADDYEIKFKGLDQQTHKPLGETFYANYDKASALVKYLDLNGKTISDEFKFLTDAEAQGLDEDGKKAALDKKYPTEKAGTADEAIDKNVYTKDTAPKLTGYKFNRIELNPKDGKYALSNKATIKIYYEKDLDVIAEKDESGNPNKKPEGYVQVKFVPTDKAKDATEKIFYVHPKKDVTIPIADPVAKATFTFKEWKMGAKADGAVYNPKTPKKFTDALTTITATYDSSEDIIPYDPSATDPMARPDGYVRVSFAADDGLSLTDQKAYYVKKNAGITLGNAKLVKPGHKEETGYKFDKWDKEDTLEIKEDDVLVTAKAKVLHDFDIVNHPGYVKVTFKAGANGVIKENGNTINEKVYYVNPNKYVNLKAPTPEGNTGYDFSTWKSDKSQSDFSLANFVNYKEDTVITAMFNQKEAVYPKLDGSTKPAGYVEVTFAISGTGGRIGNDEITTYFVDPNRQVSLKVPKTIAGVGFEFDKWRMGTNPADQVINPADQRQYSKDTTIYGSFKKLEDIIPATNQDGTHNLQPIDYVAVLFIGGDHANKLDGQILYYVNPKANPAKTIGSLTKPTVTPDTGWKYTGWDVQDSTVIKDYTFVVAQYEALDDVVPALKDDGTPNKKPDGYVKVTFKAGANGTLQGGEKTYFVNPTKYVKLTPPTTVPNTSFEFSTWESDDKDLILANNINYTKDTIITAKFNTKGDVIAKTEPNDSQKPAGFVTVNFVIDPATGGKIKTGETITYFVRPNTDVTIQPPKTTANTGYEFDKWSIDTTEARSYSDPVTTVKGEFSKLNDIIPYKNPDGTVNAKPEGYVIVNFLKGDHGVLDGQTTFYVNPKAKKTIKDINPTITVVPSPTYKHDGWDTDFATVIDKDTKVTAKYTQLPNIIKAGPKDTAPDGYVVIIFETDGRGTITGNKAYEDKTNPKANENEIVYFVNPKKDVKLADATATASQTILPVPSTTPNDLDKYIFDQWRADIDTKTPITRGRVHIAMFKPKEVKLTYDKNGADVTGEVPPVLTVDYDTDVRLAGKGDLAKKDASFKGWKIDEKTYQAGDQINLKADTTAYAQWGDDKKIIEYNPDDNPTTRPDDTYVRVTFAVEDGLKLKEQKAYYVKKDANITLGDTGLVKPKYDVETGYKFDKWDKDDSLVITTDTTVTAKSTKLGTVIPEKDINGQPNAQPEGYKVVVFKVKDGDADKGSITGVNKFYVNPTEYVTINPPTTKANTGFEFGAWDKDTTRPTVYADDVTTIEARFNELKDVVPKTKTDDSEKPKGYVTVTFEIKGQGGNIAEGKPTVYFVNPEKEVTVTPPQTVAETGYVFEKWNQDTTIAKKYAEDTTVKGKFKKLEDIVDGSNPRPDGYVKVTFDKGEHGTLSGQKVYYVNPKADQVKVLGDASIVKPKVKAETGYKFTGWDKEDTTPIKGTEDIVVKAQYEEIADVIPKTKTDESEKPEGYITVTFSAEENGKLTGQAVYYVNPNKAHVLKDKAPKVTPNTGFDFAGWDTQIDKSIQYSNGYTIKALYNAKGDVIPQEKPDGTDKPAGYVKVMFDRGVYGNLSGKTVYYVNPNKEVTVPAPTVKASVGYEFSKWDKALKQKFKEDTRITAEYKQKAEILPQEKTDGSDKPSGYITVTFKADANGSLAGKTVYYVNPEKIVDLTDTANSITKNPNTGYTAEGGTWDKELKAKFNDKDVITFKFKALDDVIEEKPGVTKPSGYVTVKLIPTDKARDKTEKVYFVNPLKEVTITEEPVGTKVKDANDVSYDYKFTGWTVTRGAINSWKGSTVSGKFIQDTDITAKYSVTLGNIMPLPIPKDNAVTAIKDKPEAKDLIKNPDDLPQGTTFAYADNGQPKVDQVGNVNAKVKVTYPNGKTSIVEVPVTVVDNVVPQVGNDRPLVPDSFIKVTVDPTDAATDNTNNKKIFWVKPNTEVKLDGIYDPIGKDIVEGNVKKPNKFTKWTLKDSDPVVEYKVVANSITTSFAKESTIIANYENVENIAPKEKDPLWFSQYSKPEPKDFIKNVYNDNDSKNKDNLPPGTKFAFKDGIKPPTGDPGPFTATIEVTYPNGEVKPIDVPYTVTGDVVEQENGSEKPTVPENYVPVTVNTTDKATDDSKFKKTFWVNPKIEVTIPVANPKGKYVPKDQNNPNDFTWKFIGWETEDKTKSWNDTIKDRFTAETTTIVAKYIEGQAELVDIYYTTESWKGVNNYLPREEQLKDLVTSKVPGEVESVELLTDSQDFAEYAYSKLSENNIDQINRPETINAKVTLKDGTVSIVEIPIVVYKNIYEGLTNGGKPDYVAQAERDLGISNPGRDDNVYVRVTLIPTAKAKNQQRKTYYVRKNASVIIPEIKAEGRDAYKFIYWKAEKPGKGQDNPNYGWATRSMSMFRSAEPINKDDLVNNGEIIDKVDGNTRMSFDRDTDIVAQYKTPTPTPDEPDKPNPDYPNYPEYRPNYSGGSTMYIEKPVEKVIKVPDNAFVKEVRYMQGFKGKFRPFDGLTRAEAAQILANALKEDGYKYDPNYKISYKDIGNAWYTEAVKIVTQANVFKGYDDGNFKPQEKITRAEWIGTLKRFQELRDLSGNHMNLREGHWAMAEIEAAYQAGWLAIYSDGLADFKADEFIPRQEVAAVSNKAFERVLDKTYIKRNDKALVNYKDINDKMWSYEDILCASNTFLHDKKLYRAHGIDMSNEIFNINLDGFTITKDKFQRIER